MPTLALQASNRFNLQHETVTIFQLISFQTINHIDFFLFILLKSVCKELKLTDDYIHFYCCQNYIIVVWHFLRGAFNDARRVGNDTRPLRRWEVHKRDSHENTDLFLFVRFYSNTPPSLPATRFVLSA